MLAEVSQLGQLLFVDHVEAARRADRQHDAQVEQVILLELVDAVRVDASADVVLLVQAVVLVYKVAEFVLDQLCFVAEVLYVAAHQLAQAEVLIERRRRLVLTLEDVAEAGAQSYLAPAIEDDLRARQVRVRHVVLVQRVDGPQN